jgi:tetratricopeptide (TPR) repeat protein
MPNKLSAAVLAVLIFLFASGISTPCDLLAQDLMNPNVERNHNQKGLEYFQQGFYQLTPKGQAKEAEAYYELAIVEFKKAVSVKPDYLEAHRNLARVYFVQKKYGDAAGAYKKVVELSPNDLDSYVNLALAYIELHKYQDAIDQLEIAKTRTADEAAIQKLSSYVEKVRQIQQ